MTKRAFFHPDPTIERCAVQLVAEALTAIERDIVNGYPWYMARERVLAELSPGWVRDYGKEAADMAVRAVHAVAPGEMLSNDARKTVNARRRADLLEGLRHRGADSRLNVWCVKTFGFALY